MESYEILWKNVLSELEKTVSSISFNTYITMLKPVDVLGNRIILVTKSKIFKDTVDAQMAEKIKDALKKSNSEITDYSISVADSEDEYRKKLQTEIHDNPDFQGLSVRTEFTFESFVVGSSNDFLYAAAKSVAENPGDSYNPLFIYGGSGLGKTHMLMAIANYLKVHRPSMNVLYTTCERFTNQLVESIGRGKNSPQDFRNRYRSVDVLLIDDVQFLAKKQATQTEFFHTFNELINENKQIVLTSDRSPAEIEVLEDRLRTRFEGGLLADVQPPDLETRIAILRRKAAEQKTIVDIKVLTYIAESFTGDIRSLIGKLTKVTFASKLHERPITVDFVKEALKESTGETQEELKVDDIISCVSSFYKITKAEMLGKKKNKEFVEPRQICIYLITELLSIPLVTIGQEMGGRDHATVIYARDKIADQIKTDSKLATQILDMKKKLLKQ